MFIEPCGKKQKTYFFEQYIVLICIYFIFFCYLWHFCEIDCSQYHFMCLAVKISFFFQENKIDTDDGEVRKNHASNMIHLEPPLLILTAWLQLFMLNTVLGFEDECRYSLDLTTDNYVMNCLYWTVLWRRKHGWACKKEPAHIPVLFFP